MPNKRNDSLAIDITDINKDFIIKIYGITDPEELESALAGTLDIYSYDVCRTYMKAAYDYLKYRIDNYFIDNDISIGFLLGLLSNKFTEIKPGDQVRINADYKKELRANGLLDHLKEFGNCIGEVENYYSNGEFEQDKMCHVRWKPSDLRQLYDLKYLERVF